MQYHMTRYGDIIAWRHLFLAGKAIAMANAVATALNCMRKSVQLPPRDEESIQLFI